VSGAVMHSLPKQFSRFASVGVLGFLVNAAVVESLSPRFGPFWAQCLAFPTAATVTWWLNRRFTFGASQRTLHQEWLHYVFANSFGWLANNGVYLYLVLHLAVAYQHPVIAVAAGSLAGMLLNFVASRWIVFRD